VRHFYVGELMFKRIAFALIILVVAAGYFLYPHEKIAQYATQDMEPQLAKSVLSFEHVWSKDKSHPLMAAAAIDIDCDGRDEVFLGGAHGQADGLFKLQNGVFKNIASDMALGNDAATYGAVSIDINDDGTVDLLTVGNDGFFIWLNRGNSFEKIQPSINLPDNSVPVDLALADIDLDGDVDVYLSVFVNPENFRSPVYNDPAHAKTNTDITTSVSAGLQNTFVSSFTNLDGDALPDLILSQNTGEIEILKNLGEGKFERVDFKSGFGFWMGLAIADYDADGDMDLFFSNIGNSIPQFVLKGDLGDDQPMFTEWLLLRNDGDFKFTDVTQSQGLSGLGFSWGASFSDINLDGNLDLAIAQNYIKWPVHSLKKLPSKLALGTKTEGFAISNAAENINYSVQPLIIDMDGNGKQDILWANINSKPVLYTNETEGDFVAVRLPDAPMSANAKIQIDINGAPLLNHVVGQGLGSDSTSVFTLGGIGNTAQDIKAKITWANGDVTDIDQLETNKVTAVKLPAYACRKN